MSERDPMLEAELIERLTLDARPGPAARISSARAQMMVQSALDAALPPMLEEEKPGAFARLLGMPPAVRAFAMAAAVLLMLAGGAAAAKLVSVAFFAEPTQPAPAIQEPAEVTRRVEKSAPVVEEPAVAEEPVVAEEPERAVERTEARVDTEDLLQQANRARAAGNFREAAQTYALVYEKHPSSLPAYVAAIAAGSIELEHLARPEQAARLFRRALRGRPNGALDLEARQGLALALRDLGATREEISVLRALVNAHPSRPAATRARARLYELGVSSSATNTAP